MVILFESVNVSIVANQDLSRIMSEYVRRGKQLLRRVLFFVRAEVAKIP